MMLIASQICSAILILVAVVTIIAPICMMKLEFNKPIHVMWSTIIIARFAIPLLMQFTGYQGLIVPLLAIIATVISFIAYEDF